MNLGVHLIATSSIGIPKKFHWREKISLGYMEIIREFE
jgi:hypothetical protein